MFTGLIEELGTVKSIAYGSQSVKITIAAKLVLADAKIGDSIAVNGTCLTAVTISDGCFTADVMPETVNRTVLATLHSGDRVNLERTLRVGDRLGGHIVSGHIDGVGSIIVKQPNDNAIIVRISAPSTVMRYIVEKGSIAIDGISLTVVEVQTDWFSVSLIPHSAATTTLGFKQAGDKVNLEGDIIGKYVEKLLKPPEQAAKQSAGNLSAELLLANGFM